MGNYNWVLKFQVKCLGRMFYNISYSLDSKGFADLVEYPSTLEAVQNHL